MYLLLGILTGLIIRAVLSCVDEWVDDKIRSNAAIVVLKGRVEDLMDEILELKKMLKEGESDEM